MSTAVIPISQDDFEAKTFSVIEQASETRVTDDPSYQAACFLLRDVITPMIDEAHEKFDPAVEKTHAAHKEACALRKYFLDPLLTAKQAVTYQIGQYDLEQQRLREEAERKAREEADLALAEITEAAIEEVEANGGSVEDVQAVIDQPIARPVLAPAPAIHRVERISTSKRYKAEVTDMRALCRAIADGKCSVNLVLPNESALNARARADGPEMQRHVPGVRVVEVAQVTNRRR